MSYELQVTSFKLPFLHFSPSKEEVLGRLFQAMQTGIQLILETGHPGYTLILTFSL
jgi:hypothetical protein